MHIIKFKAFYWTARLKIQLMNTFENLLNLKNVILLWNYYVMTAERIENMRAKIKKNRTNEMAYLEKLLSNVCFYLMYAVHRFFLCIYFFLSWQYKYFMVEIALIWQFYPHLCGHKWRLLPCHMLSFRGLSLSTQIVDLHKIQLRFHI